MLVVAERRSLSQEICIWGKLVKFSHSIFALPFALSMFAIVAVQQTVRLEQLAAILIALVSARTSAMTFNRIVDRHIDAKNPRTQMREIPSGQVSVKSAWILWAMSSATFLLASAWLGLHCLVLAPLVLLVLCAYSGMKRFSSSSHLVLGLALAMAPGGVWYALTGIFSWIPVVMMLGVLFWVAGFDILYSCQDIEFDRSQKLWSIPASLGERRAFELARTCHFLAVLFLAWFGILTNCRVFYWGGIAGFAALLFSQHLLVSPGKLDRINAAFFTRNGLASVFFFLAVLLDSLLKV